MNVTVKDNKGNVLSDLQVSPLSEDQIDQPGANTQVPTGTPTATSATGSSTATGTATSTTSGTGSESPSKGAAAGTRDAPSLSMPWAMVCAVSASLLAGLLA